MLLKELVNKSVYGTIGYISSQDDLNLLERYILYNLEVLKEYKQIIVATNYGSPLQIENKNLWEKYFPNVILIDSKVNRGHNHGYADLDNLVFDYCKKNDIKWLCKSANDVIIEKAILDKEVPKVDFYYLNGIGHAGMIKYNYDYDLIIEEDFYPQTNLYFINVSKTNYLNDKNYLDETYEYITSLSNYNGMIWNYIKGWTCEDFLKQAVQRNNLSKYHLVSEQSYRKLLTYIHKNDIHDPSHKNILIEGVCHYAFPNHPVVKV
ncbi:hypothetical protein N8580_00295 [Akkermansiaceae bacterium]|nr:hypothetical protein [Akkermansiaceae bacterium]